VRTLATALALSLAIGVSSACGIHPSPHRPETPRASRSYLARVERVDPQGWEELLSDGTRFRSNAFVLSLLVPTAQAGLKLNAHCDCNPSSVKGPLLAGQCLSFATSELVRDGADLDLANVQGLKVTECPNAPAP
jgi:hypothetical protein